MDNHIIKLIENIPDMTYASIKEMFGGLDLNTCDREDINKLVHVMQKDSRVNVQKLSSSILKSMDRHNEEVLRVQKLYDFDLSFGDYNYIAGVDEVGRGPLAGPIVAAAVILDLKVLSQSDLILGINDSKKLSAKQRRELSGYIREKAVCYSIASSDNIEIDNRGISYCNNNIFKEACNCLKIKPELVLTDGYAIKNFNIENKYVIKGDSKSASIACASIIAKVFRDSLMEQYSTIYPQYGFDKNAGYGTKEHIEAIKQYGITPIHRKSFLTGILQK